MTMKAKLFWITLLSLHSSISFCQKNNNELHPNFIVILVDDQGWNGTSVQMKKETHLQRVIIIILQT
jgi:hypothetical protein